MQPIYKFLSTSFLRYTKYFLYGVLIFMDCNHVKESDKDLKDRVAQFQQLDYEVVPMKPSLQFVMPDYTWLLNNSEDTVGRIRHSIVYAEEKPDSVKMMTGTIYFWIWSLSLNDSLLACDETIRYRANAYPLGKLYKGTRIIPLYQNEKKSWTLCSCEVVANRESLEPSEEYNKRKHLFGPTIYTTETNQLGGLAFVSNRPFLREEDLRLPFRVMLLVIVHVAILGIIYFALKVKYRNEVHQKFLVRSAVIFTGFTVSLLFQIFIA